MDCSPDQAWSVAVFPGRGEGLMACRDLLPGDHILSEAPLALESLWCVRDWQILRSISAMSTKQKAQYEHLHNALQGDPACPDASIGKWRTIAFRVRGKSDKQAVFALISKFNHSCSPNVACYWDDETGKMTTRAAAYINRGEELFLSYTSLLQSRSARRKRLKDIWKFDCACEACNLPDTEQTSSDERRLELSRLWQGIPLLSLPSNIKLTLSEKALDLCMQERLHEELHIFSLDAFRICVSTQRWEEAKEWAAIAYDHMRMVLGSAHPSVTELRTCIDMPWLYKFPSESSSVCLIA